MNISDLKPAPGSKKKRQRVGRGEAAGKGKYAGRGIKGQGSRGGKPKSAAFEGGQLPLVRRLPFKRGFNNIFRVNFQEVRLDWLVDRVDNGATVTPALLAEIGLIRDASRPVVVLGNGDAIKKKLTVHAHRFTKSASEKISNAGGATTIIPIRIKGARVTVKKLRQAELARLQAGE
ncbi:MAG: 50S ribosomal protein L15 [Anaerolineae bacterium]|nr:50S ribosomal protein L15 [Anaerolineae bacterium]